jgi:hypothetical protein
VNRTAVALGALALVVLLASTSGKPAPSPPGPPHPPWPAPHDQAFAKGETYVLTLDFEDQSSRVDQVTYNKAVDDLLDRLSLTETKERNAKDPAHVTVTPDVGRKVRIPLHLNPPGLLYVKQVTRLGPPIGAA